MVKTKTLIETSRWFGLFMAIISIELYGLTDGPIKLLLWFSISIGYSLWFGDRFEEKK